MANEFIARNGLIAQNNSTISGSLTITGGITGSLSGSAISASFASTASYAPAYLPLTGGTINGNVTVNGTASIAFLNVAYESASIIYSSGSNQLGDATNDIQTLIGRTIVSGSLEVTGSFKVNDGTNLNIDSSNRVLYRSTGTQSINWGNGILADINGNTSLNWSQYLTQDVNRSSSINWDTRKLFYTDGLTYVVDWTSLDLFDVSQISSINWGSRNLNDIAGLQSIDWGNRAQYDSLGNPSIDWEGRAQCDSFSVPSIDWNNRIQYDSLSIPSIYWENRQLLDSTGTLILDWSGSLGLLTGSVYGTSSWAENVTSASYASTASYVLNAISASYAPYSTGNLAAVQARRTTGYTLTATFATITLDATDVENQVSIISHDNTNTDRIYVYSNGLYLIHYHTDVGPGTVSDFEFSVIKNSLSNTVSGSLIAGKNSSTDKVTAGVNVLTLLNANDYVSLAGRYVGSSGGIANNVVLSVTKMEGVAGPQGPSGSAGGVTSIIAGTNITISPVGGTGDVTINASTANTNLGQLISATQITYPFSGF